MHWTIVVYHNVSWEDSPFTRAIGGITCPPDIFREHLKTLADLGDLVSVEEGLKRVIEGGSGRLYSVWFDDGLAGVRRYAFPVLRDRGIQAAMSVCSRFVRRSEFYWRFELSYLRFVDGLRFLRPRLRPLGFRAGQSLRQFTLDAFSPELVRTIGEVFCAVTTEEERRQGWELFETEHGLRELCSAGWLITNHSACHWPVGEDRALSCFEDHYDEGEGFLRDAFGSARPFAVIPFDRGTQRSPRLYDTFFRWDAARGGGRYLVLLGNRSNRPSHVAQKRILYRLTAPIGDGRALRRALRMV